MRNARQENLSEHTLETAYIAHALCCLEGTDPARAVLCALYHDCSEIITGDMPTPIKYLNETLRDSYKQVERDAAARLLSYMPESMRQSYSPCFFESDPHILQIVKAADKLSALMKCIEEIRMGNRDFESARKAQEKSLRSMNLDAVDAFMEQFLPAYELTLDEL